MLLAKVNNLPTFPPSTEQFCTEDEGIKGLAITWILLTIALVIVSLRAYLRIGVSKSHWWDDYLVVASLVIGFISGGLFTQMISNGTGQHLDCLHAESASNMLEYAAVGEAFNVLGVGLVKICACLTLIRTLGTSSPLRLRYFLWILLLFIAVSHLAFMVVPLVRCRPLATFWDMEIKGSCMSTGATDIAGKIGSAIDIGTTLVCAFMPLSLFGRLKMSYYTKVGLCVLMGLGVFTAACAVARAVTVKKVTEEDYSWHFLAPSIWGAVEQFLGIAIVSVPPLTSLVHNMGRRPQRKRKPNPPKKKKKDTFYWAGKDILSGAPADETPKQMSESLKPPRAQRPMPRPQRPPTTTRPESSLRPPKRKLQEVRKDSIVSNGSSVSTFIHDDQGSSMERASVLEKGFQIGSLEKEGEEDWLWEWEPPDVLDRGSKMFTIPHLQTPKRSRAVTPKESWQGALRRAL